MKQFALIIFLLLSTTLAVVAQSDSEPLNRAIVELQAGRTDKAIAALTEAISQNPQLTDAYFLRGNLKLTSGDSAGALADINKVIQLKPDHGPAYGQRATIRLIARDLDGAIQDLTSAIKFGFNGDNVYLLRGQLRSNKGDLKGAVEDFNETIRLNPGNPQAYQLRGSLLMQAGNAEQALKDLDFLLNWYETEPFKKIEAPISATAPNDKPGASFSVGVQEKTNNSAPGDKEMVQTIAGAYVTRGLIKSPQGKTDSAITDFTKAIRLDSKNAWAFYFRANEHETTGDLELALADMNRAIQIDPMNGNLRVEKGVILVLMGRPADGQVEFNMLLQVDRENWQKRINERLEAVKKKVPAKNPQSP